jgi:protein ImuA
MARAMRGEGLAAFVDGRAELYPPAAAALGVDLSRLLIVRPGPEAGGGAGARRGEREPLAALWAAEALLASGAFEVVAMDLPFPSALRPGPGQSLPRGAGRASPESMGHRLRAAAEKGGAVGLWLSAVRPGSGPGARVPAAVRLEVVRGPDGPRVHDLSRGGGEAGRGA